MLYVRSRVLCPNLVGGITGVCNDYLVRGCSPSSFGHLLGYSLSKFRKTRTRIVSYIPLLERSYGGLKHMLRGIEIGSLVIPLFKMDHLFARGLFKLLCDSHTGPLLGWDKMAYPFTEWICHRHVSYLLPYMILAFAIG